MKKNRFNSIHQIVLNRMLILAFALVLSVGLSKPVTGQVLASFESSRDFLRTDDGQYKTLFLLETDKETYSRIVSNARSIPETLTFASRRLKRNKYQCTILYTHPTEIAYVKKTLLFLGIEQLKIANKLTMLQDYNPEL